MVSLTTVYIISITLASVGAIGSAYVSERISPLPVLDVKKEEPKKVEVESEPITLVDELEKEFGNLETAKLISDFIKNDEMYYKDKDPKETGDMIRKIWLLTHPDKDKCSEKIKELCSIIFQKAINIRDILSDNEVTTLGDQTEKALEILSSS